MMMCVPSRVNGDGRYRRDSVGCCRPQRARREATATQWAIAREIHASVPDATGSVWSVARGLARNAAEYKQHLMNCDSPRRNDLDGRGALSEEALAEFTKFFLKTCLDQVRFMEQLVQPDRLRDRILLWAEEEVRAGTLPAKSGQMLEAVLFRGELPRGDVPALLGASERAARRVVSALLDRGVLFSESTRASLFITFPATLAARWMPGLFPEQGAHEEGR
jgi:hypothetical protein